MKNERSIYNKVRTVLETAKQDKFAESEEILEKIKKLNQPVFFTLKYIKSKREFKYIISEKSISKTVKFCQRLSLLNSEGNLTTEGRNALKGNKYDYVIAKQVHEYLLSKNVDLDELNTIISANLKNDQPLLTNSKDLWDSVKENIKEEKKFTRELFSKLITLLGSCGYAKTSQSKIYLEFRKIS